MRVATTTNELIDINKLKLVEYLSIPKAFRQMSLKIFARQVLGVSEPTVHSWKKDRNVILSVQKTIKNKFANDIPDVLMALKDNAIAGDPRSAKLFLDYVDGGINGVDLADVKMSREEAKKEIEKLTNKLKYN